MRISCLLLAGAFSLSLTFVAAAQESGNLPALSDPVKLMAGGQPIAVDVGHAAPFVLDLNKDRKPDLLVGQFGGGKVRVYMNQGTAKEPKLTGFVYLQAGGVEATVPPS